MNETNEILNELNAISPLLAKIPKVNVFSVPDNYFNELQGNISIYVHNHNSGTAGEADNSKNRIPTGLYSLQQVPEGYFNTLSDSILAKIKNNEQKVDEGNFEIEFPVLHSLKNINVFTVPENYFSNLSDEILKKVAPQPAKIINISTHWWKYAAAAVLVGIISFFTFQIINLPGNKTNTNNYATSTFQYKTPEQLTEGIASLSDEEIIKYLEKNGNILDNELLIKESDASELPSTFDYLLDENTLNDYLNKIDATSINKNSIQ